jgi:hypothetical protein
MSELPIMASGARQHTLLERKDHYSNAVNLSKNNVGIIM